MEITIYYISLFVGLVSGTCSTFVMTVFEIPFYRLWGIKGVYEFHESEMMISKLLKRSFSGKLSGMGMMMHMLNGSMLAVPFVFYMTITNTIPSAFMGIAYAIVVWIVTLLPIHKTITGESLGKNPYGYKPIIVSIFGHFIYGFVLYFTYVRIM